MPQSSHALYTVMAIDLVRDNVLAFMYPREDQLARWRSAHREKVRRMIGYCEPLEPLCALCRLELMPNRRTAEQSVNQRRDSLFLFVRFRRYIKRLTRYLERFQKPCRHRNTHYTHFT